MSNVAPALALTGHYSLDPAHSRIGFVARRAMFTKVRGTFSEFEGSGYLDVDEPTNTRLELTIKAASIDTRNHHRDVHLRSNYFFDMATYPDIRFVSLLVERASATMYRVSGDLTIKGVTNAVTIDLRYTGAAVDPYDNHRIGFEGGGVINRKAWGVKRNVIRDAGGVLLSSRVEIEFEVSATKSGSEVHELQGD
jgi:polyisoprenoid-binding protein YceI